MFDTPTFNYDRAIADEGYYGFTNTHIDQEDDDEDEE